MKIKAQPGRQEAGPSYSGLRANLLRVMLASPSRPVPNKRSEPGSGTTAVGLYPINSCGVPPRLCVPAIGVYSTKPLNALLGRVAAYVSAQVSIEPAPLPVKNGLLLTPGVNKAQMAKFPVVALRLPCRTDWKITAAAL